MSDETRVLHTRNVFTGKVFAVRVDTVEQDGTTRDVDVVEHAGSVAILARTAPDRIVLVEQYRHAAGRKLWEIPAGVLNAGEAPESAAIRELREETGYAARRTSTMFKGYPTPGYCSEILHFVLADDLRAGEPEPDEDERIEVREVTLAEAAGMQAAGEIVDLKTMTALLWLAGANQ